MPLKVSSNNKGVWITWESPDESQSATFRIKPEMDEAEMLAMLVKATTFIAKQMGEISQQIAELEMELLGGTTPSPASSVKPASIPTPPGAPRIQMMSPASLSDAPAGGAPVHFGWGETPPRASGGPQVPGHLAGEWELIPPGEM